MGNNQSNQSTSSNPNWKSYVIERRVELGSDKVRFYLDGNVKYSDRYCNYIDCFNDNPLYVINFNIIDVRDLVEVNWYYTEDYNSSHIFTSSENLRVIRFQQTIRNYSMAR